MRCEAVRDRSRSPGVRGLTGPGGFEIYWGTIIAPIQVVNVFSRKVTCDRSYAQSDVPTVSSAIIVFVQLHVSVIHAQLQSCYSIETFSLFLPLIDDSLVSWTKFLADQGRTLVGQSQSPGRTSSSNRVSLGSPQARSAWTANANPQSVGLGPSY